LSPDGRLLAVVPIVNAFAAGAVELRDARSGELLHTLGGHGDGVARLRFSADGKRLLTLTTDERPRPRELKAWDCATGKELLTLSEPATSSFAHVALSADGRVLAVTVRRGRAWDEAAPAEVRVVEVPGGGARL